MAGVSGTSNPAAGGRVYVARSWREASNAGWRYPSPVNPSVENTGEACLTAGESGTTRVTSSGPPPSPAQIPTAELMALMSDRYRILKRIGRGGMGEVFLAEHAAIGKQVAIKILSEDFARKPRIVQRFLQEARAASLIRHENVVDITDFGHTPSKLPFLTMEYLDGEDLKAMLRREIRLPWPRARRILLQVLAALEAAHEQGVIHRDIKPDNCFRLTRGENEDFIKVLDFGIAKVLGDEIDQALTQTGVVMGSAEYMSPEQAKSEPIDARTDLYSVGVILYQMLTGKVPFRANGFMGTLSKHIMEPPPPPRQIAPEVKISRQLEQLVLKALAKEPAERFQSAREFAAALRALPPGREGPVIAGRASWRSASLGAALCLGGLTTWSLLPGEAQRPGDGVPEHMIASVDEPGPNEAWVAPVLAPQVPVLEAPGSEHGESSESGDAGTTTGEASAPDPGKRPRPRAKVPEVLSVDQLRHGFAQVEPLARECRKYGVPGAVVHVQLRVTPAGVVEGAAARKPYQGTSLGNCVEAAASKARFPAARTGQRAEPGFKL